MLIRCLTITHLLLYTAQLIAAEAGPPSLHIRLNKQERQFLPYEPIVAIIESDASLSKSNEPGKFSLVVDITTPKHTIKYINSVDSSNGIRANDTKAAFLREDTISYYLKVLTLDVLSNSTEIGTYKIAAKITRDKTVVNENELTFTITESKNTQDQEIEKNIEPQELFRLVHAQSSFISINVEHEKWKVNQKKYELISTYVKSNKQSNYHPYLCYASMLTLQLCRLTKQQERASLLVEMLSEQELHEIICKCDPKESNAFYNAALALFYENKNPIKSIYYCEKASKEVLLFDSMIKKKSELLDKLNLKPALDALPRDE